MLALREARTFSCGMSSFKKDRTVKLGFVELTGLDAAKDSVSPDSNSKINVRHINSSSFLHSGKLNKRYWNFSTDTGSDVSIVYEKLGEDYVASETRDHLNLVYPTGEMVLNRSRVIVDIELGKFSEKLTMLLRKCRMIVF